MIYYLKYDKRVVDKLIKNNFEYIRNGASGTIGVYPKFDKAFNVLSRSPENWAGKTFPVVSVEDFLCDDFDIINGTRPHKPFGYSYLLDMYACSGSELDSLEVHYRFLEKLVHLLGMTPMGNPVVIHAPVKFSDGERSELYPDKAGVSGNIFLVESGCQIHSCIPSRFSSLDVYSCKKFDPEIVKDFAKKTFKFEKFEEKFTERGNLYGNYLTSTSN